MVQQITKGIKVSVETKFEGTYNSGTKKQYAFTYKITIENTTNTAIQLLSRYWLIKDALNFTEMVEGDGVIGIQPVIQPGQKHRYSSGCLLVSPFGSMQGHYQMMSSNESFKVGVPLFKLSAPFAMN